MDWWVHHAEGVGHERSYEFREDPPPPVRGSTASPLDRGRSRGERQHRLGEDPDAESLALERSGQRTGSGNDNDRYSPVTNGEGRLRELGVAASDDETFEPCRDPVRRRQGLQWPAQQFSVGAVQPRLHPG